MCIHHELTYSIISFCLKILFTFPESITLATPIAKMRSYRLGVVEYLVDRICDTFSSKFTSKREATAISEPKIYREKLKIRIVFHIFIEFIKNSGWKI